jgi:hypothetical protein
MAATILANTSKGLFYTLVLILAVGCKAKKARVIKSPPNYSFAEAQTIKLDLKLKEMMNLENCFY